MSKYMVTFIGQPVAAGIDAAHFKAKNPDPNMIAFSGVEFPLNVPVPFKANSPKGQVLIGKLKGNNHFRVEMADEPKPIDETSSPLPETPAPEVHPEASPEAKKKREERAAKKAAKA